MDNILDMLEGMPEPDKKQAKAYCNWRLSQELSRMRKLTLNQEPEQENEDDY